MGRAPFLEGDSMTEIESYQDALAFIHGRDRFKKVATLDRMRDFLAGLNNPQRGLHYLHVTGTNGKGSVTAMTRDILGESGLVVGTFTSPFITRYNERIAIDGQPIEDHDLVRLTRRIAPVVAAMDAAGNGPTEFEIGTAIMFCYMQERQPDVVILEVGIGGKWDSTNVVAAPLAVAITTVGFDHMKYLGDSLAAIASQKAGIIKPGAPVVTGQLPPEAAQVVKRAADQAGIRMVALGRDFSATNGRPHALYPELDYDGLKLHRARFSLGLIGDFQVANGAVAVTLAQLALAKLGLPVVPRDFAAGLKGVVWPARLELVNQHPLMLLDGAHNLLGIQALVKTIRDDFADRQVYLELAILADKQVDLMLGELASLANVHLVLTRFEGPGPKRPSADLTEIAAKLATRSPVDQTPNWQEGLVKMAHAASADDVLIVTGSLYFVSSVRNFLLSD